ncbi:hypothetical protein EIK56_25105 [Sphingomonas sp. C8-2]|nr:hypothetical protein EIK56_25105 [Sphingomonas sp. C8-2]
MKIKATRTFLNDIGTVRRGEVVDIRDIQAKSLIERGIAVPVEEPAKGQDAKPKPEKPKADPKAKAASTPEDN